MLKTLRRFERMVNDPRASCAEKLAAYAAWHQHMGSAHSELFSTGDMGKVKRLGRYVAQRRGKLRDKVLLRCERV